ncbi:type VII secretion protein EccB [Mycolicibacterium sp. Y3]
MTFVSRTPVNENPDRVEYRRGFVTRHQVTGWRFLMRRIASGIALHDTRMLTDPLRTQSRSLMTGVLIVVTGLIGCFVFTLIRPNGAVGNNTVLADRDTSALYVRVDGVLHPVLNLTSARLIAGQPARPETVGGSALDALPRGVQLGISGAPERMVQSDSHDADWTVCDSVGTSYPGLTIIGGAPAQGGQFASALPGDRGVLVDSGSQGAPVTWLLWNGRRSRIDLADRAVTDALGLGSAIPPARPIAPGLFNVIPEGVPLQIPAIPGAGAPVQFTPSVPEPVGSVVAAYGDVHAVNFYAVLPDGLQRITPALAALLRNSNSYGLVQPPWLSADEIARMPVSRLLDTDAFPADQIELSDTSGAPVTCARWVKPGDATTSSLTLLSGAAVPIARNTVDLHSSGAGTATRAVLPTGKGYFVQTAGQQPTAPQAGSVFWVSDIGMRYGLEAASPEELSKTIAALGLSAPPLPIPWSVLRLFAAGPALSRDDALTAFIGTEN